LPEDKGLAIPDPDTVIRLDIPIFERVDGQIELVRGIVQNMVHFDEDACAKLGGIPFVVQSINGGGAPANAGNFLKDGDVDGDVRVIAKVVCRG
jgi:hypothetical protein